MTNKENTRVNNINTGRREVRRGGRRKTKPGERIIKERRTLRLNYIKDDYENHEKGTEKTH